MERLIKIGSVTLAARARRELLKQSLPTRLSKAESTREGCVWGLRVPPKDLPEVTSALRKLGFDYELI